MRTFVALNLASVTRRRLAQSLEGLRQREMPIRWIREESLHLTLKFLGDIEGAEVPRLDETLRAIARRHPPLTLRIQGLGAFPSLRRASIVWAGVVTGPALMALQADVELAMSRLGYMREQKPFRPHVTVGRTHGSARAPDIERLAHTFEHEDSTEVKTIDLMRSHADAGGSRYEPLLRLPLGAEEPGP